MERILYSFMDDGDAMPVSADVEELEQRLVPQSTASFLD